MTRATLNDVLLSLLCGVLLLAASRALFAVLVGHVPDAWLIQAGNPLLFLSLARLALFALVVAAIALPLGWLLARHASQREVTTALPGAACAAVLYFLLERARLLEPFPLWLDVARALVLLVALPLASRAWWRRRTA